MRLYRAIKNRKPIIVFLVAIFVSPFIGLLYINRGLYALLFLIIMVYLEYFAQPNIQSSDWMGLLYLFAYLFGVCLATYIAKHKQPEEKLKWYARYAQYFIALYPFILLLLLAFRILFYEPFNIPAQSMLPTLDVGSIFWAQKNAYGYSRHSFPFNTYTTWSGKIMHSPPSRGDIVVFAVPFDVTVDYVMRIIGLPGDTIQMRNGHLLINGQPVKEEIVSTYEVPDDFNPSKPILLTRIRETLPEGKSYEILNKSDYERLDNTGIFVVPAGHYFVLGDNRDNSRDSRVAKVGFIPDENIFGKMSILIYDGKTQQPTFRWVE